MVRGCSESFEIVGEVMTEECEVVVRKWMSLSRLVPGARINRRE